MKIDEFWSEEHSRGETNYVTNTSLADLVIRFRLKDLLEQTRQCLYIGVGNGSAVRELVDLGIQVWVVDLVKSALNKVSGIVSGGWLSSEIDDMADEMFDLAISHLVVQHMATENIRHQFGKVISSLRDDGVFAFQFATALVESGGDSDEAIMRGGHVIPCHTMERIVNDCGGLVLRKLPSVDAGSVVWAYWQVVKRAM